MFEPGISANKINLLWDEVACTVTVSPVWGNRSPPPPLMGTQVTAVTNAARLLLGAPAGEMSKATEGAKVVFAWPVADERV